MVCCLLRQVAMFVNGLFENRNDLGAFKNQLRDFLIQSKEFSAQVGSFHDNLTLMVIIRQLFMKLVAPISYGLVVRRLVVIGFHDKYDHVIIMLVLVWPELTKWFSFNCFCGVFFLISCIIIYFPVAKAGLCLHVVTSGVIKGHVQGAGLCFLYDVSLSFENVFMLSTPSH